MELLAFLWYFINFDRAKRKFHVCLGVSHEKECFQEIAAGLSYKAVGENNFERLEVIWNDRLPSKFTLNDCQTVGNRSTLTLAWSSWIGRSSLGRTWVPSVWRFFLNEIPCNWALKGLLATSTLEQQSREVFISGYGLTLYRWPLSIWPIHYRAQEEGL